MGRRKKQESKLDLEEMEGEEAMAQVRSKAADVSSSDDEEADEDWSLKIVEKALLMRAVKLASGPLTVSDDDDTDMSDGDGIGHEAVSLRNGDATVKEEEEKKKKTKLLVKKVQSPEQITTALVDKAQEEATGAVDVVNSTDPNLVEVADNMVLRKLLVSSLLVILMQFKKYDIPLETQHSICLTILSAGPRYFDPSGNSWGTCYNCGEEAHAAANCTQKRKKPGFFCGSLEHNVKGCPERSCFICKSGGHRAKDCPNKKKRGLQNKKICLKCGKSGHDMFHCGNDYSPEDLKEIQCYICKGVGHLCCLDSADTERSEISCYKCGLSDHTGSACGRRRSGNQGEVTPSSTSCYECGEEGHFARKCTSSMRPHLCCKCGQEGHFGKECNASIKLSTSLRNGKPEVIPSLCYKCGQGGHKPRECQFSTKSRKRNPEPSTPISRFQDEDRNHTGLNSPSSSERSGKRIKNQDIDGTGTKPQTMQQNGGWVSKNPGAGKAKKPTKNNQGVSPATPNGSRLRFLNSQ